MGLFLRQNESRSQLQSKIAADLSERLAKREESSGGTKSAKPTILDNQRQMSTVSLAWALLIAALIAGLLFWLVLARA